MSVRSYSPMTSMTNGDTQTGLDQIVTAINTDQRLTGTLDAQTLTQAASAANRMNQILVEAVSKLDKTGTSFSATDIISINTYIRKNYADEWSTLNSTNADGFNAVAEQGSVSRFLGNDLIGTVASGLYDLGFALNGGALTDGEGHNTASLEQVAQWLGSLMVDHSNTGTGLDRITDAIVADAGLNASLPASTIAAAADTANALNHLLLDAIAATKIANDSNISEADIRNLNKYIRSNPELLNQITNLHGDNDNGVTTGFHQAVANGFQATLFGQNASNTIADGLYHLGFAINGENLVNEDGNSNASVSDVASWLNYFLNVSSGGSTGTGLDRIVRSIHADTGLAQTTTAANIAAAATDTDKLNQLIIQGIASTKVMTDGWLTADDISKLNQWIRSDSQRLATWNQLVGEDQGSSETGFHRVQGNGATALSLGDAAIDGVFDSIYHLGAELKGDALLNRDGSPNVTLDDLASYLNYYLKGNTLVVGDADDNLLTAADRATELLGNAGDDTLTGGAARDLLLGGSGNDLLVVSAGNDWLDGGEGSDTYLAVADAQGQLPAFTLVDTGVVGQDTLLLNGYDISLLLPSFNRNSGLDIIDARAASGTTLISGGDTSGVLDFRYTALLGNIAITGGAGNDTILGSQGNDTLVSSAGTDLLDGGEGSDTYRVNLGRVANTALNNYQDSGETGTDTLELSGSAKNINLTGFSSANGIEILDASRIAGNLNATGNWDNNAFDYSFATIYGNFTIDASFGNDTVAGSDGNETIIGGVGNDLLDGRNGSDIYTVTGNEAGGWSVFNGYDTYQDTGTSGIDTIKAVGKNVDIGLNGFNQDNGIDRIDASEALGWVRLLADGSNNVLDFRNTEIVGNVLIDGSYGNDTIFGSAAAETYLLGAGTDSIDGGNGSDTYLLTSNAWGTGWADDLSYNDITDTGTTGIDVLKIVGTYASVGLTSFGAENGIEIIDATGVTKQAKLMGGWQNDNLDFSNTAVIGNIQIDGFFGDDTIVGSSSADTLLGGGGNDDLDGGEGGDTYLVSGYEAGGWGVFEDFDNYYDSGTDGAIDVLKAVGKQVDIGVGDFSIDNGIEVVDGRSGKVRLLGDWDSNTIDIRGVALLGNITIDGGYGNDTLIGADTNDTLSGGSGDDYMDGGNGSDTYLYTGSIAEGWGSFQDFDRINDTGLNGTDVIKIVGQNVDVGMTQFSRASGVEVIDARSATGNVRILGDWDNNVLDFRNINIAARLTYDYSGATPILIAGNVMLDGGEGDDTIYGSSSVDTITGGGGNDSLNGGTGNDTYLFGRDSGADTITDNDSYRWNWDSLNFGSGINANQLWFNRSGSDLKVSIIGTHDSMTITNWFDGAANQIEQFKLSNSLVLQSWQVNSLVNAMAGFAPPEMGQTTLPAPYQAALSGVISSSWHVPTP